jgi:hypothetical protein
VAGASSTFIANIKKENRNKAGMPEKGVGPSIKDVGIF